MENAPEVVHDVSVLGLGYIGLPTAAFFASCGLRVSGFDVDTERVMKINRGEVPFIEPGFSSLLAEVTKSHKLTASTRLLPADHYIISVPTPLMVNKEADESFVIDAVTRIAPLLSGGELIILESTSPPGLTLKIQEIVLRLRPDLSAAQGKSNSVYFAYAPERVLPGKVMVEMKQNARVVGGTTQKATQMAANLYSRFCEGHVHQTDSTTAEMVKLTENAFRDVNIAFANELSIICEPLGVNVWELIRLANKHPRVDVLQPGPGVGGHCIAVDPWFIASAAPEHSQLIRTARKINDYKPKHVVSLIEECLTDTEPSSETTIGILGITFKRDIDDLRESPALEIAKQVATSYPKHQIQIVEPNLNGLPSALRSHDNIQMVDLECALSGAEILVLLVDHTIFQKNASRIAEHPKVIDTRGVTNLS